MDSAAHRTTAMRKHSLLSQDSYGPPFLAKREIKEVMCFKLNPFLHTQSPLQHKHTHCSSVPRLQLGLCRIALNALPTAAQLRGCFPATHPTQP